MHTIKLVFFFVLICVSSLDCNKLFQKVIGTYKHDNILVVKDVKSLFWCIPPDSENCARVLEYKISEKETFECTSEVSFFLINHLIKMPLLNLKRTWWYF
jgi:hypothetical protein